jgi:murein L,D-transpeptidase YafK
MLCKLFAKRFPAYALFVPLLCGFLAGCEDSSLSPPARDLTPIPPKTVSAMEEIGSSKSAPILIRSYKKEAEFEVWKMKADGHYAFLKSFPLCRWSGQLGPKLREGDRQVPEGFYSIIPAKMNPQSSYYLSFDIGYPNAYDHAHGHTGGSIMVHGACSSAGCFSMTDAQIAEIYAIVREAFGGGQHAIQMQSYPFRMTAENLGKYRLDPNIAFWKQLKEGSDNFEVTKQDVAVGVCEKRYVFNATPVNGAQWNETGPCPAFKRDEEVQKEVAARRVRDEAKIAELAAHGVRPIRTVYSDGGQHPDFASWANYSSRPQALAQGPVDEFLDEAKPKKGKAADSAKKGAAKQNLAKAAATPAGQNPKPAESVEIAAASAEPAKSETGSFFSRLWQAIPGPGKAEKPKDTADSSATAATSAPASPPAPLPPKRKEPTASIAKPAEPKAKPQNSVAAPAPVAPHAALPPSDRGPKAIALLRSSLSPAAPAQQ